MRKIICYALCLITFATPSYAAVDPFTWAMAGSVALHTSVIGLIARYKTANGDTKPTSTGGAAMQSTVVWVELVDLVPTVMTKVETSSVSYSDLKNSLLGDSLSTPLSSAFFAISNNYSGVSNGGAEPTNTMPVGSVVYSSVLARSVLTTSTPNHQYQWGASTAEACSIPQPPYTDSSTSEYFQTSQYWGGAAPTYSTYLCHLYKVNIDSSSNPVPVAKTQAETITALPAAMSTPEQKAAVATKIIASEALLTSDCGGAVWSNGDYVSISDCTPSVNPPNAITLQQQTLAEGASSALGLYNTASNNYTSSPTSGNATALNNARTNYNNAANALNNSLGSSGISPAAQVIAPTTTTPVSPSGNTPPSDPSSAPYGTAQSSTFGNYSGSGSFNVGSRFKSFFDQMKTTAVFSLPNQFSSSIPQGGTSTMSFNGGRFGNQTFDFSTFSGLFVVVKSLFLVVCSWVALKIITKGGA